MPAQTALPLAEVASRGVYQWKPLQARCAASSGVAPVISVKACANGRPSATRRAMAPGTSDPERARTSSTTVAASR